MSRPGGQWGNAVWGGSLWGFVQFGAVATGTLTTQALIDAINQDPPVALEISITVTIDGVDMSALVESVGGAHEGIARAQIVMIGSGLGVVKFDDVVISETITVIGVGSATGSIFRGSVQTVTENEGAQSQSTTLTCYGDLYTELNEMPTNTTWTGAAVDLALSETDGISSDIVIPALTLTDQTINYSTKLTLLKALAGTSGTPLVYVDRNGILVMRTLEDGNLRSVEWEIPLSAQTWQGPASDALEHFNRITVQGYDGSTETANDLTDQASHGIITGDSIALALTSDSTTMIQKGTAEIARSMRDSFIFEMVLHPFLNVGDVLTAVDKTGGTTTGEVMVEAITSWSYSKRAGGWIRFRVSEVPA